MPRLTGTIASPRPSGSVIQKKRKCPDCDYTTDRSYDLKRHQETHKPDSERQFYRCHVPGCQSKTGQKSNLNGHFERVHSGVYRYPCNFCDRLFNDRSSRDKHERRHAQDLARRQLEEQERPRRNRQTTRRSFLVSPDDSGLQSPQFSHFPGHVYPPPSMYAPQATAHHAALPVHPVVASNAFSNDAFEMNMGLYNSGVSVFGDFDPTLQSSGQVFSDPFFSSF
ncbi:hypothetical protein GLOTRDRAFT_125963 [Gloeophyllum trabeum ATCC 11539]|uniref:C2H2-type domain-containing protein n=1 Tax=Gloeophyllum trabeum (strain ATCC 11539 / FP-39264 / Madison 617) TaxID=670483 RepID=S7RXL1_GLOTA|nr:uncharacterized protein GLOTRDRAFT_125963 [Gloeophyllum trabeum ATCC 11539]EPQ59665.1 hypothetical protein GLOTRDRAFT_125963 [Gloeophyllum trabeum ATCC 11539]